MRIKELRKKCGLTQEKLAVALGVDRSTITCWETGRSKPRTEVLLKLSNVLGCTVDELLKEENKNERRKT